MDDIVPSQIIETGTPLGRLASTCKAFATWEPHLGPSTYEQSIRAEAAAKGMSKCGVWWIGSNGPFYPSASETDILWSSTDLHRFTAIRDALPHQAWRELREKMSDRFTSRWNMTAPLSAGQVEWFRHSNAHQLNANLEDVLLFAFCALRVPVAPEDIQVLTNLLELWVNGAYVVGATKDRLVLMHGS
jgi:hypothetical protein